MEVDRENEAFNALFVPDLTSFTTGSDELPLENFSDLDKYLADGIGLPESGENSIVCTPHQSVESTPILLPRNHHVRNSGFSTAALKNITNQTQLPPQNQLCFDNLGFTGDGKGGYIPVGSHLPDSPPYSDPEAFSPPDPQGMSPNMPSHHPVNTTISSTLPNLVGPGSLSKGNVGIMQQNGFPGGINGSFPGGVIPVPGDLSMPLQVGLDSHISLPQIQVQPFSPKLCLNPQQPGNFDRQGSQSRPPTKKRKYPLTPENTFNQNMLNKIKMENSEETKSCSGLDDFYNVVNGDGSFDDVFQQPAGDGMAYTNTVYQSLKWQTYQPKTWHKLYDGSGQEMPMFTYKVEADKGFNFAHPDEAFVCQKKNHFQVTVHVGVNGYPCYVKTENGLKMINSFYLHLHGIKMEAMNSYIKVEQSQADRSKRAFQPIRIDVRSNEIAKATVGRLHFSETTNNNMRKKGKPNPDQRFFMLVVSIHGQTEANDYLLAAQVSERIIVRASNPGQFENDVDVNWQRGPLPETVFHIGRVGINTDKPDEALTINGNMRITGQIMQPSDLRAKEDLQELDPQRQLENISRMRILTYKYNKDFLEYSGLPECDQVETGVIAQELMEILPDAVQQTGDVVLPSGENIDNFLVINKDRIFMENIGAVKELCRLNNNLETRINELEKVNSRLIKLKRFDSVKSSSSGTLSRKGSGRSDLSVRATIKKSGGHHKKRHNSWDQENFCLSPRAMQCIMVLLLLIMAFCVVTMSVLFVLQARQSQPIIPPLKEQTPDTNLLMNFTTTQASITTPNITMQHTTTKFTNTRHNHMTVTTRKAQEECLFEDCNNPQCCVYRPFQSSNSPSHANMLVQPSIRGDAGLGDRQNGQTTVAAEGQSALDLMLFRNGGDLSEATVPRINHSIDNQKAQVEESASTYRKRREAASATDEQKLDFVVTEIITSVLPGTIVTEMYCRQPCGGESKNFTYEIPVSLYFPVLSASLQINTSVATKAGKCKVSHEVGVCQEQGDVEADDESKINEGAIHFWTLPIGFYVNSTYSFRFMPTHGGADCNSPPEDLNVNFIEYNFLFYRDFSSGVCPENNQEQF